MDNFAKCNTYKVWGRPPFAADVPTIQTILYKVDEVITSSVKSYGGINECIKFKFRGTEQQFKIFLSVLTEETEFKVHKIKKCWF